MRIIYAILGIAIVAGLGGFGAYEYKQNQALSMELAVVDRQVAALADAIVLSASSTEATRRLSEELQKLNAQNQKEIEALAKRASVAVPSQDQLLTAVVAKATPAVVSVIISKDIPQVEIQYINPFADRDIGIRIPVYRQVGTKKTNVGAGTGFIIRSDGYIITNKHVVSDTNAEYVVLLSSGAMKTAQVFHRDEARDLAILKISGTGYPIINLGDSTKLKLGQTVAAIGNALGEYNNSVSVGIISGLSRTIQAQDGQGNIETLSGVIQTDAAINKGNSGGPLLDLEGKAIGVNVAVQQDAANIGFAVPINSIRALLNQVL